jgi:hypothetical protein
VLLEKQAFSIRRLFKQIKRAPIERQRVRSTANLKRVSANLRSRTANLAKMQEIGTKKEPADLSSTLYNFGHAQNHKDAIVCNADEARLFGLQIRIAALAPRSLVHPSTAVQALRINRVSAEGRRGTQRL